MCLAIFKPAGRMIKRAVLTEAFRANGDGAGFCYIRAGRIVIDKGHMTFRDFWRAWCAAPVQASPALVHFRWRTHGTKSADNCHPFALLHGRAAMIHNGVLGITTSGDRSDSATFADEILSPLLAANPADSRHVRYVIEHAIGYTNKIAVLFADGRHVIYNEGAGHWHRGSWFSNRSYEPSRWRYTPSSTDDYCIQRSYTRGRGYCQPRPATALKDERYCATCKSWYDKAATWDGFCPKCYSHTHSPAPAPKAITGPVNPTPAGESANGTDAGALWGAE